MNSLKYFFIIYFVVSLPFSAAALSPPADPRELVGEKLEYEVHWGFIPAASASMEVAATDEGSLKYTAKAQTRKYIDSIYPLRNYLESIVSMPELKAFSYSEKIKEGWKDRREVRVNFNVEDGRAEYFKNGRKNKTIEIPPEVQDPLSCLYAYRALALPDDAEVDLTISDGKKVVKGKVVVLRRETIETPAGSFKTVVVEPKVEGVGGIFKKSPKARVLVWLTDDEWRTPVRLKSKVIVGHFVAEITKLSRPDRKN